MFLDEIKIIDLERSVLDETKKSKPEKGEYFFKKKVYTTNKMADARKGLAGWKFKWNRNDDRCIRDWQIKWGFSLVTPKDPYWPEGIPPDAEGKYVFGDAVLMKIQIAKYAEKRTREIAKSDRAARSRIKEFEQVMAEKNVKVEDEFIERYKQDLGIT